MHIKTIIFFLGKLSINGQPFYVAVQQDRAGTYVMGDYPLEEPFFTMLTVELSNVTRSPRCYLALYNTNMEGQLIVKDCECAQKKYFYLPKKNANKA
jgi:hypothetical protein